jgi:hypothetical protein
MGFYAMSKLKNYRLDFSSVHLLCLIHVIYIIDRQKLAFEGWKSRGSNRVNTSEYDAKCMFLNLFCVKSGVICVTLLMQENQY